MDIFFLRQLFVLIVHTVFKDAWFIAFGNEKLDAPEELGIDDAGMGAAGGADEETRTWSARASPDRQMAS